MLSATDRRNAYSPRETLIPNSVRNYLSRIWDETPEQSEASNLSTLIDVCAGISCCFFGTLHTFVEANELPPDPGGIRISESTPDLGEVGMCKWPPDPDAGGTSKWPPDPGAVGTSEWPLVTPLDPGAVGTFERAPDSGGYLGA